MENLNGYIAIYNNSKKEIYASSSYNAQNKAQIEFQKNSRKKIKGYDIIIVLCEKNDKQVTHKTSSV